MDACAKARSQERRLLCAVDTLQGELIRQGGKHLRPSGGTDDGERLRELLAYVVSLLHKHLYLDRKVYPRVERLFPERLSLVGALGREGFELRRLANAYARELARAPGRPTVWMIVTLPRFLQMLRGHLEREEDEALAGISRV